MKLFDNIRARHELNTAFGQLDIYWHEVRGTDRDTPEVRAAVMQRCDEAVRSAPTSWALDSVHDHLADPNDERRSMEHDEYICAWEKLQLELAEEAIEDELDETDPLLREDEEAAYEKLAPAQDAFDQRWPYAKEADEANRRGWDPVELNNREGDAELGTDAPVDELPADEPEVAEESVTAAPTQYLGYADGELVRDVRSGVTGRVRVRDDEEIGRYAEVRWDGVAVSDQLEVAIDNGPEREPDPSVGVPDTELGHELDDVAGVAGANEAELDDDRSAEYRDDINTVVEGLRARGRHEEAQIWRDGADEFLAGRTGSHNWHSAKELLHEFDQDPAPTSTTPELGIDDAELVVEPDGLAEPEPTTDEATEPTPAAPVALEVAEPELVASEQEPTGPASQVALTEPELVAGEQELPELGQPVAVATAEPELVANEQELAAPTADAELEADATPPSGAEVVAEQEQSTLTVAEPELTVDEPGAPDDEVKTDPEPEPEPGPEQPSSWWQSKTATAKTWLDNKAAVVRGRIQDKAQFAKAWISELRSGRHRQCHGAWEESSPFGGVSECTIQVAKNEFGVSLDEIQRTFGHGLVNDVLYQNDVEGKSYRHISDFMEDTLLKGRRRELDGSKEIEL